MSRATGNPLEPKARGANRSTKAAGKLKVLPEQPDISTIRGESPKEREESTGGDSEDADVDENEEQEDVEVCVFNTRFIVCIPTREGV
jgi:hypothetical protein